MKVGYTNQLSTSTFSGGSNPTYAREDDSLKITTLNDTVILTITPTAAIALEFIAIINYNGASSEVKINHTTDLTQTENLTTTNKTGFEYSNYYVDISSTDTVTSITIENDSGSAANIGFVWAGDWIDFGCAESVQFFDESTDDTTIDKRNKPYKDDGYLFQTVNITTKKEVLYTDLKTNIRKILSTGFSVSRPFLFSDGVVTDELMFGILASGRVGYDFFQLPATYAQCTLEIKEVV